MDNRNQGHLKESLAENTAPEPSANARWAFINNWQVPAQPNDRASVPRVAGGVGNTTSFAHRSAARRKHQTSFKLWSQGRAE
jgi:hypothetical protein